MKNRTGPTLLGSLARALMLLGAGALLAVACGGESLTADAGEDFSVAIGSTPTFDGCDSSGDIVNYGWVILEAPAAVADDSGKVLRDADSNCSFSPASAMEIDEAGTWTIELTVTDSGGNTSSDQVSVEVG